MDLLYSPRSRAERLIAGGRVVLAASSLFAIWQDPSEPAKYATIAYGLLMGYVLYAAAIALLVWRSQAPAVWAGFVTHGLDLAFFSVSIYFTSGPSSPFIAYFVFALVCATVRWQWRGTLWTAIASLVAYFGLGAYFGEVLHDPGFELNKFIIRGFYMAVLAVLLGYLGAHEQRTRREISLLASWPAPLHGLVALIESQLAHTATVLGSDDLVLAWADSEGGRLRLARWRAGSISWPELADPQATPPVATPLAERSVLVTSTGGNQRAALWRDAGSLHPANGDPLAPWIASLLGPGPLVSTPLRGELFSGRLFARNAGNPTADDLVLAEVVAAVIASRLDHYLLAERLRTAAATEERVRLARDLHDGVLQSFTGFGLRVATVRRLLAEEPGAAERRLEELQQLVAAEQRDLRFLIQELEPAARRSDGERSLEHRLAELLGRVEHEWQLEVTLDTETLPDELPDDAARDVYLILREALTNAVRHGGANRVTIRLGPVKDGQLAIRVADDGHGFAFQGRFTQDELERMAAGPRTLRERVKSRGGSLVLETDASGARLEIGVPV